MQKSLKIACLLVLLGTSVANLTSDNSGNDEYQAWKARHGKVYADHEDRYRAFLFQQKQAAVKAHNQNPDNSYSREVNKFAAETHQELILKHTGALPPKEKDVKAPVKSNRKVGSSKYLTQKGYELVDWTAMDKVNPVRDQGSCGGCWAFTSVDAVQSAYLIYNDLNSTSFNDKTNQSSTTITFSVQQLIDCAYYQEDGCLGGWMDQALDYAIILGLTTQEQYPYVSGKTAKYSGSCKRHGGSVSIKNFNTISTRNNCEDLMPAIYQGPVVAPIYATWEMFTYQSGIFSCDKNKVTQWHSVNHAVVITGIADSDGTFIIKQTWGKDFGENGYMRLNRKLSCNVCGKSEGFLPQF